MEWNLMMNLWVFYSIFNDMLCSVLHLRSIEKKGFGLCKLGHDYSICELKKHFLTQISSAIKEHPIESKYIYIYI